MSFLIDINWDEEAAVWYAVCDDIPIALESGSFDALIERVKTTAKEILELNYGTEQPTQLCIKSTRLEKIA